MAVASRREKVQKNFRRFVCPKAVNLATYLNNRYLQPEDTDFIQYVTCDVAYYLKLADVNRVLVFPPVESYYRLLIHKTVEESFEELCTFSIGEEEERRTVVCLKTSILRTILEGSQLYYQEELPAAISNVRRAVAMSQHRWDHGGWNDTNEKNVTLTSSRNHGRGRGRGRAKQRISRDGQNPDHSPTVGSRETDQYEGGMYSDRYESRMYSDHYESSGKSSNHQKNTAQDANKSQYRPSSKKPETQLYVPRAKRQQPSSNNPAGATYSRSPNIEEDVSPHYEKRESISSHTDPPKSRKTRAPMEVYVPRARRQQTEHISKETVTSDETWEEEQMLYDTGSISESSNVQEQRCTSIYNYKSHDKANVTERGGSGEREGHRKNFTSNQSGNEETSRKSAHKKDQSRERFDTVAEEYGNESNDRSRKSFKGKSSSEHISHPSSHKKHHSKERQDSVDVNCDNLTSDQKKKSQHKQKHKRHRSKEIKTIMSNEDNYDTIKDNTGCNLKAETDSITRVSHKKDHCSVESSVKDTRNNQPKHKRLKSKEVTDFFGECDKRSHHSDDSNNSINDSHVVSVFNEDDKMDIVPLGSAKEVLYNEQENKYSSSNEYVTEERTFECQKDLIHHDKDINVSPSQGNNIKQNTDCNIDSSSTASYHFVDTVNNQEKHHIVPNESSVNVQVLTDTIETVDNSVGNISSEMLLADPESILENQEVSSNRNITDVRVAEVGENVCSTSTHNDNAECGEIEDTDETEEEFHDCDSTPMINSGHGTNISDISKKEPDEEPLKLSTNEVNIENKTCDDALKKDCDTDKDTISKLEKPVSSSNNVSEHEKEKTEMNIEIERCKLDSLSQSKSDVIDTAEEEDEDSWDKLFDDDGEALDPKLMEELTIAVGKVKVTKTQFDYYNYKPKDPDMDYEAYNHLIEIYDFPKELETRDLVMAFVEFKDKGFEIKWVDDTHAIGVFSSVIAANSALTLVHPLMKVRPLSEASRQSKMKAKKSCEFLQPYKHRPETVASVARNLVAGALGLQTNIPKEKRDEERRKLKEAREQKKAARKQKQAAWDGSYGKCAMDDC